ncbi:Hint domain-containing protein [Gluconobacter cerinus]|uniref:Hint domain-containing protein n=1 Tax=Gluconobacter cerinus TaxID=38307 RepID=UPI001B8D1A6E|nr:Hint domain-containing protein [Gluconobacter cerinus]MBS1034296.1 Hint domain-containing protein [Gluconobacter cerinus]
MSYVSNGTLYVTDAVGGAGAPGSFYGAAFSSAVILSGGEYSGTGSVASGAGFVVSSGGRLDANLTVSSGGSIELERGSLIGYSSSTLTLLSGASLIVDAGAQQYTGENYILSGGTISAYRDLGSHTWTSAGGTLIIESGVSLSESPVAGAATVAVSSGGSLSGGTFVSGNTVAVYAGGVTSNIVASSGAGVGIQGTGSNVTIDTGAVLEIASGGLVEGSTINGGTGHVDSGGSLTTTIIDNSAIVTVSGGATASGLTLETLGTVVVSSGGTVYNTVISSGGGLGLAGTASGTVVNSGGVLEINSSGVAQDNTITSGGAIDADAGSVVGTTTVSSGGSLTVASSAAISGVVTIANGGSATIWNNAGGTIDLVGDTNHGLTISGLENGGTVSTVISGYTGTGPGDSDSIDLAGVSPTGATYSYPSNDQVVVTLSNGNTITLNIEGVKTTGFALVSDGNGGSLAEVCFLAGSLISIPSGTIAVEKLAVGDNVTAYVDGTETVRQVTWAGQARCTVRPHLALDQAGYPVRILKNAIAEGVPFKDMLITAEHCLFFDGKFVPARMLVNGRSIFYDTSITSYDYYHIETADHSVIMADGMLTESYLDTGNRRAFRQNNAVVSIPLSRDLSWDDAAAPLTVSREAVEPIYRQIEGRAKEQNCPVQTAPQPLTYDSDLHLVTDTGATIRAARTNNDQVIFMIPVGVGSVRIASRASRPYDALGPFVDDRRTLGVLVGDIRMFESNATRLLSAHLIEEGISGWSNVEDGTVRWTEGNAFLSLGHRPLGSIALLSVQILASGPYLVTDTTLDVALQA